MTTKQTSAIARLYAEAHRQAARTGTDRFLDLRGGARLAVRVRAGVTTVTISRAGKDVGATELEVFRRDCQIPADAQRIPSEGQGAKPREGAVWHYVAYRWGAS